MDKMFKCSNCGAEYDKKEPECPFCGYINEEGAEKEYMGRKMRVNEAQNTIKAEA